MNILNRTKKISCIYLIIFSVLFARESDNEEQLKIGNFAVEGTMQVFPFLGFGENIIEQGDALIGVFPTWLVGEKQRFAEIIPSLLYGVRDDFSILWGFPTALSYKEEEHHSSGSADLFVQFEYAFYAKQKKTWTDELTIVASVFLPSGNECKVPATGLGSPNFFLGLTASHLSVEWYFYISGGGFFAPRYNNNKNGNRFIYEFGFGKNIAYNPDKWTMMWLVEFAGTYAQKSSFNGVFDNNTGFNRIFFGPSIFLSTQRIILQAGIAPVIFQHLFGEQLKTSFFTGISLSYKFN